MQELLAKVQAHATELAALAYDARDLGIEEAAGELWWLLRHGLVDPDTPMDQVFPALFAALTEEIARAER